MIDRSKRSVNVRSKIVYDLRRSSPNHRWSSIRDSRKIIEAESVSNVLYILSNKGTSDHRKKDNYNSSTFLRVHAINGTKCSTTSKRVLWFVSCTKHTKYADLLRRRAYNWYRSMHNHHTDCTPIFPFSTTTKEKNYSSSTSWYP